MANPLQPKCIAYLERVGAYVINVGAASKSGHMDLICCIQGLFYGFEIKWKNDQPSELQKEKINKCIDAGGKAYFIRDVKEIADILFDNKQPVKYQLKNKFTL